jgi:ribosomal protein S18 acetylase RimI-like enzyme
VIRPQQDDDIEAVAELHVAAWRSAYPGIMPAEFLAALDPADFARRRRAHPSAARTLLATAEDGTLRGFATSGPARDGSGAGEVFAIYVHPEHWRGGHGRALLAATFAALAAEGHRDVQIWVAEENHPARRFYERMGLAADGGRADLVLAGPGGTVAHLVEVRYTGRLPQRYEEEQRDADPDVDVAADEADRP